MADALVFAVVEILLYKIQQVVLCDYELRHGVGDTIQSLLMDLEFLRRLVTRANINSDVLQEFVKEVRSLCNEAEDAVDSYTVLVHVERSKPAYSRFVNKLQYLRQLRYLARNLYFIGFEMRDLKEFAIRRLDSDSSPYLESRAQEFVPIYLKREKVTKTVLKVSLHCEGCVTKILKFVAKTAGCQEISVDREKDLVIVKGELDVKELVKNLKKHLKRDVEIVPPKKDDKKEKGNAGCGGGEAKAAGGSGGVGESGGGETMEGNKMQQQVRSVVEDNMVGFEDARTEVITLLTGESGHLEVISIVGKFGLGKTTLAKNVLTDPRIENQFPVRAFVRFSQQYDIREVFLDILRSFTQVTYESVMTMQESELAAYVRQQLETRRYLIIMDDVTEKEDWDKFKVALSNNKNSSRVLITTRKKYVAAHANPSIKPYYLRLLRLEESRELLRSRVFGENSLCIPELEKYESEIAAKCDGLPLAILLTAGYLLNDRESIDWWKRVIEYLHEYNVRDQEHAEGLVHLWYNHLPYHLKICFLYLGVFPMGFQIPVSTLLRLWIAEEFIAQEDSMSVEEVAERYLEELVSRNLVIVGKRNHEGRIKTCQINESLRDFCKKKAVEEDLFQEIEMATFHLPINPSLDDPRRLCIGSNVLEYFSSKPSCEGLRTFLTFADKETTLSSKHASSFSKAFKLLRVLEAKSLNFTRFPLKLCNLVLLKYLAISCSFKTIPPEMSTLQNMQTLIVKTTSRTLEIRADIWKMKQLKHLHSNASMDLPSPSKGKEENRNLQIMSTISPESCKEDVFRRTPYLKMLGIRGKLATHFEANTDFLHLFCLLTSLENLKLFNDDVTFRPRRLPPRHTFPANLRRLTLFNTLLPWDEMRTLGMLPNLEVLKLKDNAFEGNEWESEEGGFLRLRVLQIWKTNLMRWNASADHFPSLRGLVLKHCTELESLPLGLGHIPTLEFIDLEYTPQSVISSAREIQLLTVDAGQLGPRGRGLKLSVYPPED